MQETLSLSMIAMSRKKIFQLAYDPVKIISLCTYCHRPKHNALVILALGNEDDIF